jgi:FkbM family methyltransferase
MLAKICLNPEGQKPMNLAASNVLVAGKEISFQHRSTSQDIGVIAQTFEHKQYAPPGFNEERIKAEYERLIVESKVPLIIDAGANIGTSVAWFGEHYPKSHIVAIEPDRENFSILVRNTLDYWVDYRLSAIGSKDCAGSLVDSGRGTLGYTTTTENSNENQLLFLSASRLIGEKVLAGFAPFIFKCDIEGGEKELFSATDDFLSSFFLFIAEPHDWMLPNSASSQNMLRAISREPRDFIFYGENIFSYLLR